MLNDNVLAIVGDREIKQSDIDFLLKNLDAKTSAQFNTEEGKKRLIQELINQELLYLDAKESKLDEEPQFKQELDKAKDNLLKQYSVSKLLNSVTVGEDEIIEYYNRNKSQYAAPESVKACHILLSDYDKTVELICEIKKGGLSFEKAAEEYSQCPSKSRGGDLGFFTKGKMVPEFEQAAFSLEIDEISEPIKTQFGYHIIKVVDKHEEVLRSLDEVRNHIKQHLLAQKQEIVYFTKLNELKNKYNVKINVTP